MFGRIENFYDVDKNETLDFGEATWATVSISVILVSALAVFFVLKTFLNIHRAAHGDDNREW